MLADRVKETTATTGTGTITLAGAAAGFQSFSSAFTTGSIIDYVIVSGTSWECGRGTFTAAGTTLSRDEVYSSSASGSKITLAGTSDVFVSPGKTALDGKQRLHGFNLTTAAPTAITNGFRRVSLDNAANVDLAYDPATRTLTLTQTGGVKYWYKGQLVTVASPVTVVHANTTGAKYIYFANTTGAATESTSVWDLAEVVPIAEIYYNATTSVGTAWDERHSAARDIAVHAYLHMTQGARLSSGGVISGYTLELGTNAGVQFALTAATIYDEDIRTLTEAITAGVSYTCWFKSAGDWTFTTATVPYKVGATYIQYNNAGTLTELASGQFVNYWLYGSTALNSNCKTFLHVGQSVFSDLGEAAEQGLPSLDLTGFPSAETSPLYRLTFKADSTATSTGKGVLMHVTKINGDKNFDPGARALQVLDLLAASVQSAPPENHLYQYARNRSGRILPHFIGPSGLESAMQPALFGNNIMMWLPGTGTTVAINMGTSFTARNSGTGAAQAHPARASTNNVTQMSRATFGTGTTATGSSGIVSTPTVAWRGNAAGLGGFFFFCRFAVETYAADEKLFIGLSSTNGAITGEPTALSNYVGIFKRSNQTTFQVGVCGAVAGTNAAAVDTGVTPSATAVYDFLCFCKPNDTKITVRFIDAITGTVHVNNVEFTDTTTLPGNTTFLYMNAQIISTTGTTAKLLALNRIYLESDT